MKRRRKRIGTKKNCHGDDAPYNKEKIGASPDLSNVPGLYKVLCFYIFYWRMYKNNNGINLSKITFPGLTFGNRFWTFLECPFCKSPGRVWKKGEKNDLWLKWSHFWKKPKNVVMLIFFMFLGKWFRKFFCCIYTTKWQQNRLQKPPRFSSVKIVTSNAVNSKIIIVI